VTHTVILATLEVEIRRMAVPGQPGHKSSQDPISTNKKLGMVVCTCYPSFEGSIITKIIV
jgi:hypothetical protein